MLKIQLKYFWLMDKKSNSLLVESYFLFIKSIHQDLLQRSSVFKNVRKIYSKNFNSGRYYDQFAVWRWTPSFHQNFRNIIALLSLTNNFFKETLAWPLHWKTVAS